MSYLIYRKRQPATPFIIVNDNTIDNTTTSLFFVGKSTLNYGQSIDQNIMWQLENFANNTAPTPAVLGQLWYNTTDNKVYACINETTQAFEKAGKPLVSSSVPTLSVSVGDLWFNTNDNNVYSYNGTTWNSINSAVNIPSSIQNNVYLTTITTDATPTELFIDGVTNTRMVIAADTTWTFDIQIVGRVIETTSENLSVSYKGVIDRGDATAVSLVGGMASNIYNITSSLTTANTLVTADTVNNSLKITVVGQVGKTMSWIAVAKLTIVANS